MISNYSFGRIVIDGTTYTSDLIILPSAVRPNWWRDEGHVLKFTDLSVVLEPSPQVLVVGQGAHGYMRVTDKTLAILKERGIETVCAPTSQAVKVYAERCQQGDVVAASLHLTC
jgi:hypothetical protein